MFVLPGRGDSAAAPIRLRLTRLLLPAIVFPLFAGRSVWMMGAHNPYTPAGYVGYLTKGAVFGKSRFYGTQRGPTSAGGTIEAHTTVCIPVGPTGVPLAGTLPARGGGSDR